jgi:hypothetical protein
MEAHRLMTNVEKDQLLATPFPKPCRGSSAILEDMASRVLFMSSLILGSLFIMKSGRYNCLEITVKGKLTTNHPIRGD